MRGAVRVADTEALGAEIAQRGCAFEHSFRRMTMYTLFSHVRANSWTHTQALTHRKEDTHTHTHTHTNMDSKHTHTHTCMDGHANAFKHFRLCL